MSSVDELPSSIYRLIVFGVLFYFVLLAYATVTDDVIALYATEFTFGVIAIAVGTVLYLQAGGIRSAVAGAAICLVIGGALQFAYLFTRIPSLDGASSLAVFVGIGFYIYAAWGSD